MAIPRAGSATPARSSLRVEKRPARETPISSSTPKAMSVISNRRTLHLEFLRENGWLSDMEPKVP
jgi:hypothetical protein